MKTLNTSKIKKILIIKLRAIGDVLLSTVVIPNLRAEFPDAAIDFLTEKPARSIVEGNPQLNSVLVFDSKTRSGADLILEVRKNKYDLVIDLFGNPRSAIVTLLSGAAYRVGFRFGWRTACYNIVAEPRGDRVHNTEFNLDALRACQIPIHEKKLLVPTKPEDEQFADDFFTSSGLSGTVTIAFNAAGGWYTKRWRPDKFARLADNIAERDGAKIILLWGPGEKKEVENIAAGMKQHPVLIPPTTLPQLAAVLRRCSFMITNDSGPMHIAASVATPTVAIFGPTNPVLQGPFGNQSVVIRNERIDCLGCNLTKCTIGNLCMEELQVEEVLSAYDRLKGMIGR